MIKSWLNESPRKEGLYKKFSVIDLSENSCDRTTIISYLAKKLIIHIEDPAWLKKRLGSMGEENFKVFIADQILPHPKIKFSPRQSLLAEIMTAEILEELRGALLPMYKLRHKEKKDQAMRGKADVVTCKLNENDKPVISFVEVKSNSRYDKQIAKKAYEGLPIKMEDIPETITFFSKKLFIEDKYDLADKFDTALEDPDSYYRDYQIFLIFEKNKWKEDILEVLDDIKVKLPDLIVNVVLIDSLKELVDHTYKLAPEGAVEVCSNGKE